MEGVGVGGWLVDALWRKCCALHLELSPSEFVDFVNDSNVGLRVGRLMCAKKAAMSGGLFIGKVFEEKWAEGEGSVHPHEL